MRILRLPRLINDAIDNANRSVSELRMAISGVLLPLKILLWACIVIILGDLARGTLVSQSFAYRMLIGAVDQLWYVVFYLSLPLLWQGGMARVVDMQERRDWIIVDAGWEDEEWVVLSNDNVPPATTLDQPLVSDGHQTGMQGRKDCFKSHT